jgi:hypothetical protein
MAQDQSPKTLRALQCRKGDLSGQRPGWLGFVPGLLGVSDGGEVMHP